MFFSSLDGLVANDTNRRRDIYVYDRVSDLVDEFLTVQFNEPGLLDYGLRLPGPDGSEVASSDERGLMSERVSVDLVPGDYLVEAFGFDGGFNLDHEYRLLGVANG